MARNPTKVFTLGPKDVADGSVELSLLNDGMTATYVEILADKAGPHTVKFNEDDANGIPFGTVIGVPYYLDVTHLFGTKRDYLIASVWLTAGAAATTYTVRARL